MRLQRNQHCFRARYTPRTSKTVCQRNRSGRWWLCSSSLLLGGDFVGILAIVSMRPPTFPYKCRAYRRFFLLHRQRLNRLYARDTRRNEVVQVIRGKNGAHRARVIGGERGVVASPRKRYSRSDSETKMRRQMRQLEYKRQKDRKHRWVCRSTRGANKKARNMQGPKAKRFLVSRPDVAENRTLCSHATRPAYR